MSSSINPTIKIGIERVLSLERRRETRRSPSSCSIFRLMVIISNSCSCALAIAWSLLTAGITISSSRFRVSMNLSLSKALSSTTKTLAPWTDCACCFEGPSKTPRWLAVFSRIRHSSTVIFKRTSDFTRAIKAVSLTGLLKKSSAPASNPRTRSVASVRAVTITTGICSVFGSAFRRSHTSNPSIPGIIISNKIISGLSAAAISKAS